MHRSRAALLLLAAAAGCSPTFNWREVRAEPTALKAMLPCKPDKAARRVPMAGREVELSGAGLRHRRRHFRGAVRRPRHRRAGAGEVLAQWKPATLANMNAAGGSRRSAFVPARRRSRCRSRSG